MQFAHYSYNARVGDPSLYTVFNKSILCSLSLLYRLCIHYQSHHTLSSILTTTLTSPCLLCTNNITCFQFFYTGAIINSTLDDEQSKTHAAALSDLSGKASYIVGMLNPDDELTFLRIRSKQREIMVCGIAMLWFC